MIGKNEDSYQFSFEVQWNEYLCEGRASIPKKIKNFKTEDVTIESLNVKDDVAITAEDIDDETLLFFKQAAILFLLRENIDYILKG